MPRRWYLLPCRTFQPVVVTTQSLPNGQQGTAYSFQFSANGGTPPYTWSLQSDTGSNTWNISSSGLLTGTPANAEVDTITAKVTDAVGGVALSAPLSLTVSAGGAGYTFKFFIAPSLGGTLGNDTNDGLTPTVTGPGHGPWTIGSLFDPRTMNPNATQISNNAKMAGVTVGVVSDQGVLSLADVGAVYPTQAAAQGTAMVLSMANGISPTQVSVLASCNSAGQYIRGAVIDGGANGTQFVSCYMLGRFALTSLTTDCQYLTIDGIEVRNCMGGGIVFGQSAPPPAGSAFSLGWTAKNCFVHNVWNCDEGFKATGCSQTGTTVVIGTVTSGVVNYGQNGYNDVLFGVNAGNVQAAANGGYNGKLVAFVSGTPGGAGTYTSNGSGTSTITTLNGSAFGGNNLAGISFHGGDGYVQTNNFIQDVIDLNTVIAQNKRSTGIKNWVSRNGTCKFNTIYATVATGYPTGGIEHKNVPQYNNTISNNYINLGNAATFTGVDTLAMAGDGNGNGTSGFPSPQSSAFHTVANNIIIANPNGVFGYPGISGSFALATWTTNWFNNTMIGVGSPGLGGLVRLNAAATLLLNFHDNILDRVTPPAGGNGGDLHTNVDTVANIDFNLYPSNYLLCFSNSGTGTVLNSNEYSASLNGGIAGAMTALTTASGGGTTGLEHNGTGSVSPEIGSPTYLNASGTKLKASDYQLAPVSKGKGTGTGGNDKGAWGGQTQIGCNFRDPSG